MLRFPDNMNKQRGFSLIEMMIAVIIVGIVLSLGVPSYRDWIKNSRVRNAAESIRNGLQLARAEAIKRNTNVQFILAADSGWAVQVVSPNTVIETRAASEGSRDVVITPQPNNTTTVTFNDFGRARTANDLAGQDNSARITQVDLQSSQGGARQLRVMIGIGGNSRMCDPNLAATDPRAC